MKRLVVFAIALSSAGAVSQATSFRHGSLVVAMPVATGWVVCGDRRRTNSLFGAADDETKVFELTPGVVVGLTGLRRVNDEGRTVFDVAESVRAFEHTHPFDTSRVFTEALAKTLGDVFVRAVPRRLWPDVEKIEAKASSAFTVMLFWTSAGLPYWSEATFNLRGGPRYASRSTRASVALTDRLRVVTFGNLAVVDELQHGHTTAFADARRDPELKRFLIERYQWRERAVDEAERFGRRIIALTSERLPELEAGASNVGPDADCVTVDARR